MCAIKEVTLFSDDYRSKESAQQLGQEITLLSRLRHPNIVRYFGSEMLQREMETALSTKEGEKPISFEKKKDKGERKDKKRDREDRKKDKKDKEERKKEKSDKRREKRAKLSAPTKPGKLNSVEKLSSDYLLADPKGKLQGRSELVERSSVTEEHGQLS